VGEPSFDRIKKAGRLSFAVRVYSFNLKSDSWWEKEGEKFQGLKCEGLSAPMERHTGTGWIGQQDNGPCRYGFRRCYLCFWGDRGVRNFLETP